MTIKKLKNLELEGSDADGKTKTVKLRDIAKLEETQTLPSVSRLDQRTYLSVSGASTKHTT